MKVLETSLLCSIGGGNDDPLAEYGWLFEGTAATTATVLSTKLAAAGCAKTGAVAATASIGSASAVCVGGACIAAAGAGYLIGDLIEKQTGIGSAVGEWVGSTKYGSYIFNW